MSETLQHALLDTLEWLKILSREGVRPEAAWARFQVLRQQHPETQMDLAWEEEALDASLHGWRAEGNS